VQQTKQPDNKCRQKRSEPISEINVSNVVHRSGTATAGYRFGYARVSTLEQDAALQRDALTAAGCDRIFVDKASGKLEHRSALDVLLEQVRRGDTVVVWRLDRLGRSLRQGPWPSSSVP